MLISKDEARPLQVIIQPNVKSMVSPGQKSFTAGIYFGDFKSF